jgi:hypothetical protein
VVGDCKDFCQAWRNTLTNLGGGSSETARFVRTIFDFEKNTIILGVWDLSENIKRRRYVCYMDSDLLLIVVKLGVDCQTKINTVGLYVRF